MTVGLRYFCLVRIQWKGFSVVKRPAFFYGWAIVGITIVGMMLIYGIRHSFAVFFPSILDEFGWSRGSTAFMLSLNLLIYGFVAPVAGSLGDRWCRRHLPRKTLWCHSRPDAYWHGNRWRHWPLAGRLYIRHHRQLFQCFYSLYGMLCLGLYCLLDCRP